MSDRAPSKGSRRGYLVGFVLSVVLTAVPFWLVMTGASNSVPATAIAIFACAAVQVVVHVTCFLHLDTRGQGGWTLLAFVFTLVIVAIMVGGSIWIMYHINTNTMPATTGPSMTGM